MTRRLSLFRHHHIWLLLLLVTFISLALVRSLPPVSAQDAPIYGLITVNGTEVRVGPDFAYASIGQLPLDASVVVLGRAGDFYQRWDGRQWVQIQYGDTPAWVYAQTRPHQHCLQQHFSDSGDCSRATPTGACLMASTSPLTFSDQWQGDFALAGNFMGGDSQLTVNFPGLAGVNIYSVIVLSPSGDGAPSTTTTTTAQIDLNRLPWESGTYTWRVAPYWTDSSNRHSWQQVCLLRTGGTFEKPYTGYYTPTTPPTARPPAPPTATPWSPA